MLLYVKWCYMNIALSLSLALSIVGVRKVINQVSGGDWLPPGGEYRSNAV